jgi:hypothetical protein
LSVGQSLQLRTARGPLTESPIRVR